MGTRGPIASSLCWQCKKAKPGQGCCWIDCNPSGFVPVPGQQTIKRRVVQGRGNQEAVLDKLGITIRENVDLMRIQLFFDEKPTVEARQVLKGWGFKWAPSSGCWQRQLTNNARYAVKQVIDRLK